MIFLFNYLQQMSQHNLKENFYHYLTASLKLFKKRIYFLSQYLSLLSTSHPQLSTYQSSYQSLVKQAELIFSFYEVHSESIQSQSMVISRFYSRIKQMIKSQEGAKLCNCEIISKYMGGIVEAIQRQETEPNLLDLLHFLLVYLPIGLRSLYGKNGMYEFYMDKIQNKNLSQGEQNRFVSPPSQNYENLLNFLQEEFRLLKGLDFDETEFKKRFFQSREDYHRKRDTLYDDTLFRNKFAFQNISKFAIDFDNYKVRAEDRKQKKKKVKEENGKEKGKSMGSSLQKRFTQKVSKEKIVIIPAKTSYSRDKNVRNVFEISEYKKEKCGKERLKTFSFAELQKYQKRRPKEKVSGVNILENKKIEIEKSKIQLSSNEKSGLTEKMMKKKLLFKKTQQYFKKRYSIITQESLKQTSKHRKIILEPKQK